LNALLAEARHRSRGALLGTHALFHFAKETSMKRATALSIAMLLVSGAAYAQTSTTVTTGAAPGATVTIEPEYRTRIHSYITEHRPTPVETQERFVVGATIPPSVELRAVPSEWGPSITKYRYVYSNDHVVLVEPSSRKVVQIVE
jgi:Protein of unknown function (DUF1236)